MLSCVTHFCTRKAVGLSCLSHAVCQDLTKGNLSNTRRAHSYATCASWRSSLVPVYLRLNFRISEHILFGTFRASLLKEWKLVRGMASQEPPSGLSSTDGTNPSTLSLTVHGNSVEVVGAPGVTDSELRKAFDSILFKQWIKNMQSERGLLMLNRCSLNKVLIQGVDMFGERIGFLKFKAEVVDRATGSKLAGIVFARGGAVAVLMVLECGGESYVVLTEQARVPVGRTILELPAGMLDDDKGDFVGAAAREVEEETGIHISSNDLVNLTAFLDPSTGNKMFPSPGGCDEEISLLLYRSHVKKEHNKLHQGGDLGGKFCSVRMKVLVGDCNHWIHLVEMITPTLLSCNQVFDQLVFSLLGPSWTFLGFRSLRNFWRPIPLD